jgi:hypothetical protein
LRTKSDYNRSAAAGFARAFARAPIISGDALLGAGIAVNLALKPAFPPLCGISATRISTSLRQKRLMAICSNTALCVF